MVEINKDELEDIIASSNDEYEQRKKCDDYHFSKELDNFKLFITKWIAGFVLVGVTILLILYFQNLYKDSIERFNEVMENEVIYALGSLSTLSIQYLLEKLKK